MMTRRLGGADAVEGTTRCPHLLPTKSVSLLHGLRDIDVNIIEVDNNRRVIK